MHNNKKKSKKGIVHSVQEGDYTILSTNQKSELSCHPQFPPDPFTQS